MRKIILFLITILGIVFITSCKKDEVKTYLGTDLKAPLLITAGVTDGSSVVLNKINKDVNFDVVFSNADYGFKAAITYTLQMDKKGNNFASPLNLGSPSSTALANTYSVTVSTNDLNNKLLTLQVNPKAPQPTDVEFRVKAYVNDSVKFLYSPVVSVNYTPYYIAIIYPKVYVPGGYQAASGYTGDWSPADAPYLASLKSDGVYEGYVYFGATGNFKITSQADWSGTNYGDGGSGKLDTKGGDIPGLAVGYYQFTVNTNKLTLSSTKTSWSIIGSVNGPNYNWSNDTDMTYNPTTKVWTVTANLKAGEFKFRANHDWGISYGSLKVPGELDQVNSNNIKIAVDGNYTITLDFSIPPIYTYKIVKI